MTKEKNNRFWEWSLLVYELPGAKNRLIYLQDEFGFDINLALWCCWRATEGENLPEDAARAALRAVKDWVEGVIEPLREARRNTNEVGPPDLNAKLKEAELDAERREQDILIQLSRPPTKVGREEMLTAARNNLSLYAGLIDAPRRAGFSSALLRDLIEHILPSEDNT